eukprot:SAG22_NODE_16879_length_315_cov_1.472222_1_plen_49_part_10
MTRTTANLDRRLRYEFVKSWELVCSCTLPASRFRPSVAKVLGSVSGTLF